LSLNAKEQTSLNAKEKDINRRKMPCITRVQLKFAFRKPPLVSWSYRFPLFQCSHQWRN